MTLKLPEDILLDIADIFDEFTPRNKIDRAVLIIRKRYADDHNFWPSIAANIRMSIHCERQEKLLEAKREDEKRDMVHIALFDKSAPLPDQEPPRDDVGEQLIEIKKVIDGGEPTEEKPEYTLKRTRKKRTKITDQ